MQDIEECFHGGKIGRALSHHEIVAGALNRDEVEVESLRGGASRDADIRGSGDNLKSGRQMPECDAVIAVYAGRPQPGLPRSAGRAVRGCRNPARD